MSETSSAHTEHCWCQHNTAGQLTCCKCWAVYETTTFVATSKPMASEGATSPSALPVSSFTVVEATKYSEGWSQCRVCHRYNAWAFDAAPVLAHYQNCVVGLLEQRIAALTAEQVQRDQEIAGHIRGAALLAETAANNLVRAEAAEARLSHVEAERDNLLEQIKELECLLRQA